MIRRRSALLLLIGLQTLALHAQSPEDILLSHDPNDSTLSTDLQIQAALEHGGHRLAVWGTQVADGDAVVGALVMNLDGVQSVLTSSEARPYGAVDIVPMGSEDFLVVWNDRREEGAGIRGAVVDGLSGEVAADRLLDSGFAFTGMVAYRRSAGRLQIFYVTSESGRMSTRLLEVDGAGTSVGASYRIVDTSISAAESYLLPNGMIKIKRSDGVIMLWGDQGIVDGGLAASRFALPHYLTEEGGVVLYENDSAKYFRSLFDASPDSVVAVPIEIPVPPVSSRKVDALHRDSLGWYLVAHARSWLSASGIQGYSLDRELIRFDFTRPGDTTISRKNASSIWAPISASSVSGGISVKVVRQEVNVVRIEMLATITYDPMNSMVVRWDTNRGVHTIGNGSSAPSARSVAATRTRSHGTSDISVGWSRTPVETLSYSAPFAPKSVLVSHFFPSILSRERFSVSWFTNDRRVGGATLDDVAGPVVTHPYKVLLTSENPVHLPLLPLQSSRPALLSYSYSQTRIETGPGIYGWRMIYTPRCYLPLPSEGLVTIGPGSYERYSGGGGDFSERYHSLQFDPNRREITGMVTFYYTQASAASPHSENFFTFRTDDSIRATSWSWHLHRPILGFVPIDSASAYLLVTHDTLVRAPDPQPLGQRIAMRPVDTSLGERTILLQRLFGERLLRLTKADSSDNLTLEVYGFDGRIQGQRLLQSIGPASTYSVTENPIDSSIVLVVAGAEGVAAITLGTKLQIARSSNGQALGARQISSTEEPASWVACAIDAEGRLFAAWERKRGTVSEIVGNWWQVPGGLDFPGTGFDPSDPSVPFDPFDPEIFTPFTPGSTVLIRRTAPNPFYRATTLHIQSTLNQNGRVALIDSRGAIVYTATLSILEGTHLYPLDLSTLESGAYTLQVVGQSGRDDVNVIVVGE